MSRCSPRIGRRSALGALVACSLLACVHNVHEVRGLDPRGLAQDDRILLVGRVQVLRGRDLTAGATLETNDGGLGGFQLEAGGLVAWAVPRPKSALSIAWLAGAASPDGALSLGESPRLRLSPAAPPARVVYFGTIVIDLAARAPSTSEQIVGVSAQETVIEVRDEAQATLAQLARLNPAIERLDFYSVPAGELQRPARSATPAR